MNHPGRSPHDGRPKNPKPEHIIAKRIAHGLSEKQASDVIYSTEAAWKRWESGERPLHPAMWELFLLKTDGAMARQGGFVSELVTRERGQAADMDYFGGVLLCKWCKKSVSHG